MQKRRGGDNVRERVQMLCRENVVKVGFCWILQHGLLKQRNLQISPVRGTGVNCASHFHAERFAARHSLCWLPSVKRQRLQMRVRRKQVQSHALRLVCGACNKKDDDEEVDDVDDVDDDVDNVDDDDVMCVSG